MRMRSWNKSWKTVVALSLALGVVVAAAGPALSVERRPPAAVLRLHGQTVQRGNLITYCWSYQEPDSNYGVAVCADGTYNWPDAAEVGAPARVSMRFRKAQRPRRLSLSAYSEINRYGAPRGQRERLAYRLRPVRSKGEIVAWDAVFRLRESGRHYYIEAFSVWREGDAFYNFHVTTS